jgi:Fic family protein
VKKRSGDSSIAARLLDGFEGKLTTRKWAKLAKTSLDTALREINDLLAKGVLVKNPGGSKATSYDLPPIAEPPAQGEGRP